MSTRGEASGSSPEEKGGRVEGRKGEARPRRADPPAAGGETVERSRVLAALETGLVEVWSGLEVLDRELDFEDGVHADLGAVEPTGRALLVRIAGEDAGETVLGALDLLAFARANAAIVARHLGEPVDAGLEPRVAVVDARGDARVVERLRALSPSGIEVIGVRTVRSALGERSYLILPPTLAGPAAAPETFLAGLPAPLFELARALFARMQRVDPDCHPLTDRGAVVWRLHGVLLARLERHDGQLEASLASGARLPFASAEDAERVLESALERVAQGIGARPGRPAGGALGHAGEQEPLLTPEEIQAFRD
jgi:hypothetical protein